MMDWLTRQLVSQQARVNQERGFIEKLLLNLEGGLAYLNGQLVYEVVNPCFAKLFERKPEYFLGKHAFEVLPEAGPQLGNIFESVVQSGRPFQASNFPLSYTDKGVTQKTFWDGSVTPILDDDGNITGILILCFNVTDRVNLHEAHEHLAAIVEGSFDAIIGADMDGMITDWNVSAERIYGWSPDEAVGQHIGMTIPGDAPDTVPVALGRIKAGERVSFYMTERVRKDGKRLTVCLAISPIHNLERQVVGASMITRDLTEKLEGAPADVGTASVLVKQWLAPPAT
jgi:PAS domain S-box-containing protein